ncbi:hypothetical protein D1BOALGB6SA_4984 [Olavius sp. associated proteobacterium Delta 1]|nr:hypothetical protein D1BOALGB6SA_4984 [Olavius sp. associated proteobacterium Delta 1]
MKLFNNKKGFLPFIPPIIAALAGIPWILFGAGVFILILLALIYFALGKIIGTGLIVVGIIAIFKLSWKIGLPMILIGLLTFINPFGWENLAAAPLSMIG